MHWQKLSFCLFLLLLLYRGLVAPTRILQDVVLLSTRLRANALKQRYACPFEPLNATSSTAPGKEELAEQRARYKACVAATHLDRRRDNSTQRNYHFLFVVRGGSFRAGNRYSARICSAAHAFDAGEFVARSHRRNVIDVIRRRPQWRVTVVVYTSACLTHATRAKQLRILHAAYGADARLALHDTTRDEPFFLQGARRQGLYEHLALLLARVGAVAADVGAARYDAAFVTRADYSVGAGVFAAPSTFARALGAIERGDAQPAMLGYEAFVFMHGAHLECYDRHALCARCVERDRVQSMETCLAIAPLAPDGDAGLFSLRLFVLPNASVDAPLLAPALHANVGEAALEAATRDAARFLHFFAVAPPHNDVPCVHRSWRYLHDAYTQRRKLPSPASLPRYFSRGVTLRNLASLSAAQLNALCEQHEPHLEQELVDSL